MAEPETEPVKIGRPATGKKTENVLLSLPIGLKGRAKEAKLNMSAVAAKAIEAAVRKAEKGG